MHSNSYLGNAGVEVGNVVVKRERAARWLRQQREDPQPTLPMLELRLPVSATGADDPDAPADRELALITAAQTDLHQFAPLYEAYVDLVWRYAMSRLGNADRAGDATSIIFERVLAALPSFQPQRRGSGTSFRSWLMTIAHNVVLTEQMGSDLVTFLNESDAERRIVDPAQGPEAQAVAADERRRVERALGHLPPAQRRIVELRLIGMSGREIAGILGMSEGAVKTAHFRAHIRLRVLLAESDAQQGSA